MLKNSFILFTLIFSLAASAHAAVYKGRIAEMYSGGQSMKLTQVDELTKDEKNISVDTDEQTSITGVASLSDLKPGMSVSVEGEESSFNQVHARSISVL